jgi:hypothetical protein
MSSQSHKTVDVYAVTIGNSDVILNISHHGRGCALVTMHMRIQGSRYLQLYVRGIAGPEICAAISQKRRPSPNSVQTI